MADTHVFTVTAEQIDNLEALLKAHGIGDVDLAQSGESKSGGWDVSWTVPSAGELSITLVAHPFLEAGAFWSKVNTLLEGK